MSKVKASSKSSKAGKSDVLTKVKDSAVSKPTQSVKAKSKDIAKGVAEKASKKSKKEKKVKEPTPEPSESEAESESSESSDESEAEVKPVANSKGAKSSDEDSDSDSSESSDDEAPKVNGKSKPAASSDDEEEEEESDESSEDEKPAAGEADSDSDESSDDSEDDEEEEAKPKVTKRKAEEEQEPAAKKTKTSDSSVTTSPNLFIGSLSWNIDDAWLRETFEVHGEVTRAQVMTDRQSGRSKGFGYVEFANAADAANAHAEKQGFELDGRTINVDFANPRPNNQERQDTRRKSYGDQVSEPSDTLFVGNVSFDVGQEAISEAFSPYGTVLGIRLPTDRETGQLKGFGYVTFSSVEEAQGALDAMQGGYIGSRPIRLDYSQPRPQNSDSPARGRGGFGGGRGGPGGRGGRGGRGGFGGGRGGGRGGRGGSTNRGGFSDFSGRKTSFD